MVEKLTNTKKFGRPRRITLEQVIDAACEIGLERLDMTTLAQKLGTGVATLYGYVDGRDHLLRLVAGRLAGSGIVVDRGQSWEEALREYAMAVYQSYSAWPQLIILQVNGRVGDPTGNDTPNTLLKLLMARGLTPLEAMQAYSQVTQVVSGAVLAETCYNRLSEEAGGEEMFAAKLRAACKLNGYDALETGLDAVWLKEVSGDFRPSLDRLIADMTRRIEARDRTDNSDECVERNES